MHPTEDLQELAIEIAYRPAIKRRSEVRFYELVATLLSRLVQYLLDESPGDSGALLDALHGFDHPVPDIAAAQRLRDFLRSATAHVGHLVSDTPAARAGPWMDQELPQGIRAIPGMDGEDSLRFYNWAAGQIISGDVVECGCWLGQSTYALASGLTSNETVVDERTPTVHAYDSFIWQEWMEAYLRRPVPIHHASLIPTIPGQDFQQAFLDFTAPFVANVCPHRVNMERTVDRHQCSLKTIGLLIYDMGPDTAVLDEVWRSFVHRLIDGQSLVVFNEYGSVRSREIWQFCGRHRAQLEPAHKPSGTLKSFRYHAADTGPRHG